MAQRDGLLKQCDCAADQWRKCPHPWHLALQHDGRRYSISLDKYAKRRALPCPRARTDADTLAARITQEIETGTYQDKPATTHSNSTSSELTRPTTCAGGLSVDQAVAGYLDAEVRPRGDTAQGEIDPETVKHIEARCRRYAALTLPGLGRVGALPLAAVTAEVGKQVYRLATAGLANSTRHKYRQALVGLLDWAVAQGHLAASPLTADVRTKKLAVGPDAMRTRRVHPDEEANLLEAAREAIGDAARRLVAFLTLAFDTGGRKGELLALRWSDILFDEGPMGRVRFAAIERGARKGGQGRARRVPMTARVRALLQALRLDPTTGKPWASSAYVLGDVTGGRVKDVRKAWVGCVLKAHNHEPRWLKAGANRLAPASEAVFARLDLHIHDIRHEAALRWLEAGKALSTIAVLLGHHDLTTLRVYLGITEVEALRDMERPEPGRTAVNLQYSGLRLVQKQEVQTG